MQLCSSNTSARPESCARPRRVAVAAGGLLLAALTVAPALADISTPVLSGLAWRSGSVGGGFPCLAQLRNRALDAVVTFVPPDQGFAKMVSFTGGSFWRNNAKLAPLAVVSLPLLTTDTRGQFAQCAAGAFDSSWRQIGANLNAAGTQGMVVRLGWEANIGSDSHAWGVDTPDQVPGFVQCWRHAAAQLKSTAPGIMLEWTSSKKTSNTSINVLNMNPGDEVVDI